MLLHYWPSSSHCRIDSKLAMYMWKDVLIVYFLNFRLFQHAIIATKEALLDWTDYMDDSML